LRLHAGPWAYAIEENVDVLRVGKIPNALARFERGAILRVSRKVPVQGVSNARGVVRRSPPRPSGGQRSLTLHARSCSRAYPNSFSAASLTATIAPPRRSKIHFRIHGIQARPRA
jgi:hypothetical protein